MPARNQVSIMLQAVAKYNHEVLLILSISIGTTNGTLIRETINEALYVIPDWSGGCSFGHARCRVDKR